jgi:5-methylcytosine-specific restriction endonuclease McrA
MREVEKRIGATLEDDYKAYYLDAGWGHKRIANRWGVSRGQIFGSHRDGRRNWVQMLSLPPKRDAAEKKPPRRSSKGCEICGVDDTGLERAHWIPARNGGSARSDNILKLCPNCHNRLDKLADPETVRRGREIILLRAAEALLGSSSSRDENMQRQFLALCTNVIGARGPTPQRVQGTTARAAAALPTVSSAAPR